MVTISEEVLHTSTSLLIHWSGPLMGPTTTKIILPGYLNGKMNFQVWDCLTLLLAFVFCLLTILNLFFSSIGYLYPIAIDVFTCLAASVVKAVIKYGKKPIVLDENKRDTYKHPLDSHEPSVLMTFDGELKQLMAVMSEETFRTLFWFPNGKLIFHLLVSCSMSLFTSFCLGASTPRSMWPLPIMFFPLTISWAYVYDPIN
jgi:hypothetical protein